VSRRLSAAAAAAAAVMAILLYSVELSAPSTWAEARTVSLGYMWVARWEELLAQLLLLVAILVTISHIFKESGSPWSPSTPTR